MFDKMSNHELLQSDSRVFSMASSTANKDGQLVNLNHERFAQLVAAGTDQTQAYIDVYGPSDSASTNASRLRNRPHVDDRIRSLLSHGVLKAKINGTRVVEELVALGLSNVADILRINDDGTAEVDLTALTREQSAAISEVESTAIIDPITGVKKVKTKVKLFDKKGPLDTLAKHFGLLVDRTEHGRPGDFSNAQSIDDIANKIKAELGEEDAKRFLELISNDKNGDSNLPAPTIVPDNKTLN